MLCDACSLIFRHRFAPKKSNFISSPWMVHHTSMLALFEASSLRCRICTEICDELLQKSKETICYTLHGIHTIYRLSYREVTETHPVPSVSLFIKCDLDENKKDPNKITVLNLQYDIVPANNSMQSGDIEQLEAGDVDLTAHDSNDGISAWNTLTTWLEYCTANHEHCRDLEFPAWYPTRLVDVYGGCETQTINSTVRVIETADTPTCGRYVTLSHCWGKAPMALKLTTKNEKTLKSQITLTDLPRTFADAVSVTRRLGIRYIWIDSLCVLQDSAIDWGHESNLMGRVYKHSWLNIAASGSIDSRGGLFFPRKLYTTKPFRVKAGWAFSEPYDAASTAHTFFPPGSAMCSKTDTSPWRDLDGVELNRRGWVIQERVLSPRQVYFDRKRLFYECRTSRSCETLARGKLHPNDWTMLKNFSVYLAQMRILRRGQTIPGYDADYNWILEEEIYQAWDYLLQAYTGAALTHPTDRLIAIKGLAREMQETLGTRCLAGLWEERLHSQLLWAVSGSYSRNANQLRRWKRPLGAPSWSWACVDVKVELPQFWPENLRQGRLLRESIVEGKFGDDVFCQGVLAMSARLYPAAGSRVVWLEQEKLQDPMWKLEAWIGVGIEGSARYQLYAGLDETPDENWSGEGVYAMPLLHETTKGKANGKVKGLLVKVVKDRKGSFERIGMFSAEFDEAAFEIMQKLWPGDSLLDELDHDNEQDDMLVVCLV